MSELIRAWFHRADRMLAAAWDWLALAPVVAWGLIKQVPGARLVGELVARGLGLYALDRYLIRRDAIANLALADRLYDAGLRDAALRLREAATAALRCSC